MPTIFYRALLRTTIACVATAILSQTPGLAQADSDRGAGAGDLKLPVFKACQPATKPQLPEKWFATALLEPFKPPRLFASLQLVVGELVYDASVPALRATLTGLQTQSVDLLIAKENNYLLLGPADAPTDCLPIGSLWAPPSRNWLNDMATCVGEAPLIQTDVQWWKTPAEPKPASSWHWFTTDKRLPWRSLFAAPSQDLAVIGEYSMTYYPSFEAVASTRLPELLQYCRSRQDAHAVTVDDVDGLRVLIGQKSDPSVEAERRERLGSLIPGLSLAACSGQKLPGWPSTADLGGTTMMTPVNFAHDPFPTEILYRWLVRSQRTRLYYSKTNKQFSQDALLIGGTGYGINRFRDGIEQCALNVIPGTPRPDWPVKGNCVCRGVIDNNPVLSPGKTTQLLTCDMQPPSVFWTWYTSDSHPVVFYQTQSPPDVGTGLALADYYDWQPGHPIPPGTFDVPWQCLQAEAADHGDAGSPHSVKANSKTAVPGQCFTCHLGSPQSFSSE
jgi:hypothetical protein